MHFIHKQKTQTHPINYFFSQPHQPFFLMGIVHSLLGILLFFLAYKGIVKLNVDLTFFHVYWMIFIVFTHFFHGFLLTTFPRFCMSQTIAKYHYLKIFKLYTAGSVLTLLGTLFWAPIALLGSLTIFAGHVMALNHFRSIYLVGEAPEKKDAFWLLVAHHVGIVSQLILILGLVSDLYGHSSKWVTWGAQIGTWGYLFFLTFIVAQRMVPFFSHVFIQKSPTFIATVFGLMMTKAFSNILNFGWIEIFVTMALALYLFKEFITWRLPIFTSMPILWVLHLSLFWLPTALAIDALTQIASLASGRDFLFGGLHLAAIGFLTTMLIGFGTRVTLGHSGQVPHADRFTTTLFWFAQLVVIIRFAYSLTLGIGMDSPWLFDLSATLWLVLFIAWGIKIGPTLLLGAR